MQDPTNEVQRIRNELVKCGLPQMPIETEAVSSFFDKKLVHHSNENAATHENQKNINFMDRVAPRFLLRWKRRKQNRMHEKAMKVYHDLESGEAFKEDYVLPILT